MRIEDVVGNLNSLVGTPLLRSEERNSWVNSKQESEPTLIKDDDEDDDYGRHSWTYYTFATVKGWVDIRWYGFDNGYYSTRVDFFLQGKDDDEEEK